MTRLANRFFYIVLIFSLFYLLYIPVHPDEAYYWNWSRHLALSYFDGPPLTAYLLKLSTWVFGNTQLGIKCVSIVCVTFSAGLVYHLAEKMFTTRIAERALILFLLLPITQATNIITTPDAPLMLLWTLSLYSAWQWLVEDKLKFLYLTALMIGLGLLAKYTMVLIIPALLGCLIFSPYRKRLLNPHVYLAGLLVVVCFSPVVIWNMQHHWLSFKFQWHHGAGASSFSFKDFYLFLLGELAAVTPIFLLALIGLGVKYRHDFKDQRLQFLLWPFLVVFLFFMYHAATNHSEMNWTLPAFISGSILLAYFIDKKPHRYVYYSQVIFCVCVVLLLKFPALTPGWQHTPIRKFFGYQPLLQSVNMAYVSTAPVVLSDSYQNASEAAFHLPGQPNVYIITPTRKSEYTIWSQPIISAIKQGKIKQAFYLGGPGHRAQLERYFKHCDLKGSYSYRSSIMSRHWVSYWCWEPIIESVPQARKQVT